MSANEEEDQRENERIGLDANGESLSAIISSAETLGERGDLAPPQSAVAGPSPRNEAPQQTGETIEDANFNPENDADIVQTSQENLEGHGNDSLAEGAENDAHSNENISYVEDDGIGTPSREASISIEDDFESFESPARTPVNRTRPQTAETVPSPIRLDMDDMDVPGEERERNDSTEEVPGVTETGSLDKQEHQQRDEQFELENEHSIEHEDDNEPREIVNEEHIETPKEESNEQQEPVSADQERVVEENEQQEVLNTEHDDDNEPREIVNEEQIEIPNEKSNEQREIPNVERETGNFEEENEQQEIRNIGRVVENEEQIEPPNEENEQQEIPNVQHERVSVEKENQEQVIPTKVFTEEEEFLEPAKPAVEEPNEHRETLNEEQIEHENKPQDKNETDGDGMEHSPRQETCPQIDNNIQGHPITDESSPQTPSNLPHEHEDNPESLETAVTETILLSGSPQKQSETENIKIGYDEAATSESHPTDTSQFEVSSVRLEMPEVPPAKSRNTRRSTAARPKTSIGRLPLGGNINFKRMARISQRAQYQQSNVPSYFLEMMLGPQKGAFHTTAWEMHESVQESHREQSPYTQAESAQIAQDLVDGKKRKIVNAAGIADVIDELTTLQVESMEAGDYRKTCKIRTVIQTLRQNFRKQDRDKYHKARLDELKQLLSEAESQKAEAVKKWKKKEDEFKATRNKQAKELDERHEQEMMACKDLWSDEKTTRRYSKRSPLLLNRMFVEKQLLLLGDYTEATQQRKINTQSEKEETSERFREYSSSFEGAQKRLLKKHEADVREFNETKQIQWEILMKKENAEIERHTKRVESLRRILEEEGKIENFVAKKFKHGPDMVLPLSVTCAGGDDIPTMGKTRMEQKTESVWVRFREATNVPALSLPPLKFKKIRNKPKAFIEVKKKEKVDF